MGSAVGRGTGLERWVGGGGCNDSGGGEFGGGGEFPIRCTGDEGSSGGGGLI